MKKIIIVSAVVLVALALGLSLFSIYYSHKVERELQVETIKPQEVTQTMPIKQPRELIPSNPKDYGMVVIEEYNKPNTEAEWNSLIFEKIKEVKSQYPKEVLDKVADKIAEDPAKTAQKIKTIDENIAKCKETLIKEPGNKEIRDKLERLMILRSIAENLPSNQ